MLPGVLLALLLSCRFMLLAVMISVAKQPNLGRMTILFHLTRLVFLRC
jgi:hypothetical protein